MSRRTHKNRHESNPEPVVVPTPVVTVKDNLCMNYGHSTGTYDLLGQVTTDLNKLKQANILNIRLAYSGWNNTQSEALAVFAKSKGFRVIIGGDWDVITSSQFNSYTAQVLQEAKWSQDNGIDQFSLGNEQEYRLLKISIPQWITYLKGLATQVRTVYSGKISYETSSDFLTNWITAGIGSIDLLGLNSYCGYGCNSSRLQKAITAFGKDHVYISETNADTGTYKSDSQHATAVTNDTIKLLSYGVPVYYFTFSTCKGNNGVPDTWGLYQCNVLKQPLTARVLGIQ